MLLWQDIPKETTMHFRTSRPALLAVALMATLSMGLVFRGMTIPARADESSDNKLKQLLKERHSALEAVAKATREGYESGAVSLEDMYQSQMAVLKGELDAAADQKERVSILERMVKMAQEQEKGIAAGLEMGISTETSALRSRVARIEAEIALERARKG
jgi:hypothetical protein